jgi:membrane protein YqaA with SNARE-associated domain
VRLSHFKYLIVKLGHFLALYGGWGLFTISFFDSSFLAFPLVNDLLLIHLSGQSPGHAIVYALQSTAGSVLGCFTLYGLARAGGGLVWRRHKLQISKRTSRWLERNDFVATLVASLVPPPVPFKPFVISAGILRVNPLRFCLALIAGRSLRFMAEALMGVRYGARAETYFKENLGWASLAVVTLLVLITLIYRAIPKRASEATPIEPDPPASPPL